MCRRILMETTCQPGQENIVSYLPLCHVAPLLLDVFTTMASGSTCWFAQPDALKGSLIQTLREVHPTIFLGVPRSARTCTMYTPIFQIFCEYVFCILLK